MSLYSASFLTITVEPNAILQPSEHRDWTLSLYYAFAVLLNSNFHNSREWIFWVKIWRKNEIVCWERQTTRKVTKFWYHLWK